MLTAQAEHREAVAILQGAQETLRLYGISSEQIDALHVRNNGNILLSTDTSATLGGLTFLDGDIVEYNPFYDNRGQQTARLARRIMLQFLTGIAMKKEGMDPKYVNPRIKGDP